MGYLPVLQVLIKGNSRATDDHLLKDCWVLQKLRSSFHTVRTESNHFRDVVAVNFDKSGGYYMTALLIG